MSRIIKLTKDAVTIVDDEDFEYLNQWSWRLVKDTKDKTGYAGKGSRKQGRYFLTWMHRLLIDVPEHMYVDHINGNSLDNRRENLRIATRSQNQHNRTIQKNNTSGYKGVKWSKRSNKWQVAIGINGTRIHLGYYENKHVAAKVYNDAALKYLGEFALLNIIEEGI